MEKDKKVTALYCRLSKDDGSNSESLSIRTQKSMLMEYATRNGFGNCQYYVDDGYSGKKIHYTDRYLLNPYHPVTVFVIGAGGTGSQVATGLARISVALQALGHPGLHVTVFDPDTVTEANIGRQLFSGSELGLNKAVALVTRINRFFGFSWEAKGQRYPLKASADREEPALANIIVTCTDNNT